MNKPEKLAYQFRVTHGISDFPITYRRLLEIMKAVSYTHLSQRFQSSHSPHRTTSTTSAVGIFLILCRSFTTKTASNASLRLMYSVIAVTIPFYQGKKQRYFPPSFSIYSAYIAVLTS